MFRRIALGFVLSTIPLLAGCTARPAVEAPDDHQFPHLARALDVAVGPEGHVYTVQWQGDATVRKFTPEGVELADWVSSPDSDGGSAMSLQCPTNITVDGAGNLYVRELGSGSDTPAIHAFGPNGELRWTRDENSHDLAGDAQGRLYLLLTEPERNWLRVLDSNGEFVEDWSAADLGLEDYRLTSIGVGSQGNIVVAGMQLPNPDQPGEEDRLRVTVLSTDGEVLHQWAVEGRNPTAYISSLSVDEDGRIFITDMAAQLVGVYTLEGDLLHEFEGGRRLAEGAPSIGPPIDTEAGQCLQRFSFPHRLAAGRDGRIYLTTGYDPIRHHRPGMGVFDIAWE